MARSKKSPVAKALTISVLTITTLVFLFVVAVVIMVNLLNPNQFKKQISAYIKQNTGRELVLAGDIHWSFFPWLGLKLNQLSLSNPAGFEEPDFIRVGEADISVKLLPLFEGKIEVGSLTLKNATINLIKNARGNTNWNSVVAVQEKAAPAPNQPSPEHTDSSSVKLSDLTISNVNIRKTIINWDNQQTGQHLTLRLLSGNSKNIKWAAAFPVNLKIELLNNQPALSATADISAQVILNPQAAQYTLHQLNITGDLLDQKYPNGKLPFSLQTNINADLNQQTLKASPIALSVSNIAANGNLQGKKIMQNPEWQSQWKINQLSYSGMNIKDIHAQLTAKNNIIVINPLTANLYQGKSQGAVVINLQKQATRLHLNETLNNIQIGDLLADLDKNAKVQLTGTGNLKMNLQTQGANSQALLQNLQGNANVAINNGTIKNLDLGQQIIVAITRLFNKSSTQSTNAQLLQTNFASLTATLQIANGIATNNDLLLQSPSLKITGRGTASLLSQTINYTLQATALGAPFGQDILNFQQQAGGSIPIKVTGNLTDPSISPDYSKLAITSFKNKIKQSHIGQQIQQQIEKNMGGNMGQAIESIKGLLGN